MCSFIVSNETKKVDKEVQLCVKKPSEEMFFDMNFSEKMKRSVLQFLLREGIRMLDSHQLLLERR